MSCLCSGLNKGWAKTWLENQCHTLVLLEMLESYSPFPLIAGSVSLLKSWKESWKVMECWKAQNRKASNADILLTHHAIPREERLREEPRGCLHRRLKSVQTLWTLLTCTPSDTKGNNFYFLGAIYHINCCYKTSNYQKKWKLSSLHVKGMF